MKKMILYSTLVFLLACSGAKLITVSQTDVDRGLSRFPGLTINDLNTGKSLYENNCGSCHKLKSPSSRSEKKWTRILENMVIKVNKKAGKQVLGESEKDILFKYLITMGPLKKSK